MSNENPNDPKSNKQQQFLYQKREAAHKKRVGS